MTSIKEAWGYDEASNGFNSKYDAGGYPEDANNFFQLRDRTTNAAIDANRKNASRGLQTRPYPVTPSHMESKARARFPHESNYSSYDDKEDTRGSKTSNMDNPLFYNDHSHVKRIMTHFSECKNCKLSLLSMIHDTIPSSPFPKTMETEHFAAHPDSSPVQNRNSLKDTLFDFITGDTQILILVIIVMVMYIIQSKR